MLAWHGQVHVRLLEGRGAQQETSLPARHSQDGQFGPLSFLLGAGTTEWGLYLSLLILLTPKHMACVCPWSREVFISPQTVVSGIGQW